MTITNKDEKEVIAGLVAMIKRMGYKNDHPDKEYSWWYNNDGVYPYDLINTETLMDNDVAMQYFLLRVARRIAHFKIEFFAGWYTVSFGGESFLNKAVTLNEALFLSINDYINKK